MRHCGTVVWTGVGSVAVLSAMEVIIKVLLASFIAAPGRLSNISGWFLGSFVLLPYLNTGEAGSDVGDVPSPAVTAPSLTLTTDQTVRPGTVLSSPGVPLAENPAQLGPRALHQLHPVARDVRQLCLLRPQSVEELSSLSSWDNNRDL